MAWRETSTVSLRREFCALAQAEGANVSELCRRFGISRKTGYKWLGRYAAEGAAGLADRPRRPRGSPGRTAAAVEARVVALRDAHPTWGGRKLERRLQDLGEPAPPPSTITAILHRHGRIAPAASAARAPWRRFERDAPNALWQMDFTGDFPLARGRCYPLHVLDDHARYVVGLVACADQRAATVRAALTELFARYGLPWAILCDHGTPWGTTQAESGLTALRAWLERLDVAVVHGRPAHPQTQGKVERANRTLGEDLGWRRAGSTEAPPAPRYPDLAACQAAFDRWRATYNHERPHEALDDATPASRYAPSPRRFPAELPPVAYPAGDEVRRVQADGDVDFRGRQFRVSKALIGERVALRPTAEAGVWTVHFGTIRVRTLDLGRPRAA